MKRIFITFFALFLILLITGCSFIQVEDTNGDDNYVIQTFSDEDIARTNHSTSFRLYKTSYNDHGTIKVKKMSGIMLLNTTNANGQTLIYNINSSVVKGNFRIVIVSNDKIIKDIPINEESSFKLENVSGSYELKIVGESAEFSLEYAIVKG